MTRMMTEALVVHIFLLGRKLAKSLVNGKCGGAFLSMAFGQACERLTPCVNLEMSSKCLAVQSGGMKFASWTVD